jgi:outer membrane protein assembly factor BamE
MPGLLIVHRSARTAAALAAALMLGGCAWMPSRQVSDTFFGFITPYRMDIIQGNVVTKEQAAAVRPGMTRAQVRDILGSPMLTDIFHAERWDYIFTIKRQGTQPQRLSVVAFFDGDRLRQLDAPDLPSEREFVASISRTRAGGQPVTLELTEAQKQALPKPAKPDPVPVAPVGALRSYPPLEPT